jgi:pimeloyl-ACP methyl ester carboxylesterase
MARSWPMPSLDTAPPLVLLPSWLTHLDYQWRSVAWRPWLEALSSRYTLIRYDPRGCGLSDRNVPGGPPPCYAEPKIRNVVARYGWETDNA